MSRTLGLLALTGAMVLLIGVGSAEACNEPKLSLFKSSAAAGENVPFEAYSLEPGHEYVVTVWEEEVSRGLAGAQGTATGAFRMPDLGPRDRDVYVKLNATHEGSDYPDTQKIVFKGPAPERSDPPGSTDPPVENGPPANPSPTPSGGDRGSDGVGDPTAPPRTEAPPIAIGPGLELVGSKPIAGSRPSDTVTRATAERGGSPVAGDGSTRTRPGGGASVGGPVGDGPAVADVGPNAATDHDRPLFEGSMPHAQPGESSTGALSGAGKPAPEARPSERSATGDLWSGLATAEGRSLLPSLDVSSPAPGGGTGSLLAVGLGLLGGGLATLFAGLAVAAIRRRRLPTSPPA